MNERMVKTSGGTDLRLRIVCMEFDSIREDDVKWFLVYTYEVRIKEDLLENSETTRSLELNPVSDLSQKRNFTPPLELTTPHERGKKKKERFRLTRFRVTVSMESFCCHLLID